MEGKGETFYTFDPLISACYHIYMLYEYIQKQLKKARYKILKDNTYFGEIPGLRGVWAQSNNLEDCRKELEGVVESWLFLKIRDGESIPGLDIKVDRSTLARSV